MGFLDIASAQPVGEGREGLLWRVVAASVLCRSVGWAAVAGAARCEGEL